MFMRSLLITFAIVYTLVLGDFAHTFAFTLNEQALGGYFPFGAIVAAPVLCLVIGYLAGYGRSG